MSSKTEATDTPGTDIRAELEQMRAQLATLLNEKVAPRVSDAVHSAEDAARELRDAAGCQAARVGSEIRARPFTSVLIAAAVGALVGRLMR